jgi:hypothetical protein
MAIRISGTYGNAWSGTEVLTATDLNDTITYLASTPPFWMIGSLYDEYDNFSTGSPVSSSNWVITGNVDIGLGSLSGPTNGSEAVIKSTDGTTSSLITSGTTLPTDRKAYHVKGYISMAQPGADPNNSSLNVVVLTNGATTYQFASSTFADPISYNAPFDVNIIKVSGNNYDYFICGRKVASNVNTGGSLQIGLKPTLSENTPQGTLNVYMSDLVYTKI